MLNYDGENSSRQSSEMASETPTLCSTSIVLVLSPWVWTSQMVLVVKNQPVNAGDIRESTSSTPRLGRVPVGGHGNLLQCSCLNNAFDRGAWQGYSPWGQKGLYNLKSFPGLSHSQNKLALFCWNYSLT